MAFLLFCAQKIFPSSAVLTFANAIFSYVAILFTIAAVTSSVLINVMSENIIRRHVKTNAPQNSEVNASTTPLQQSKDSAKLLYEYKRLESGQIRVLELLLADEAQPISCLLHHVDLKTLPEYEALSYAWGTEKPECPISVDGQCLMVRPNLRAALQVFWPMPPSQSRWLWIDAICIDQENLPESGEQVLRKGHIYSSASRLLVWLGSEADDSSWAISAITGFARSIDEGETMFNIWTAEFLSVGTTSGTHCYCNRVSMKLVVSFMLVRSLV